jgi:ABC-type dipeptide/oligopeptide/nickel transport system permease component
MRSLATLPPGAGTTLLLLLGVAPAVYFLIHLISGDPATVMLGEGAAPTDVAALRHDLGLDRPIPEQDLAWKGGRLFRGNLGTSIPTRKPVAAEVPKAFPATLPLALRRAGQNALPPVLVVAGLQFGPLLTGAGVTETIYSCPGRGRLLVQSIQRRDDPMVRACVLFIVALCVLVNASVDVLAGALDSKTRQRGAGEGAS